ncbi:MAG: serine/threonine-protein kinase [Chloroflexota bacterium]
MDLVGQKLGKYELLEKLGQGGMAQVYKARQPMIERMVAIKVMQTHLADSPKFVERFMREAQRLGQLRHPNIVSVMDFDIVGETHYLVMDFISGPSLEMYLERRRPLPPEEALRLTSQIVRALQYAHEQGVVHNDLKPANVMFQDNTAQQLVLTDFGIARLVDTSGVAQSSTIIGTPAYMSPEAVQGKPLDGRSDLYSVGVMLYEMLTGEQPYQGDTPVSVILQHVNAPPPDVRTSYPNLPEAVAAIIERAMAKEPEARYRDAAEMGKAVEAALRQLSEPPRTVQITGQPRPATAAAYGGTAQMRSGTQAGSALQPGFAGQSVPMGQAAPATQAATPLFRRPWVWALGGVVALGMILFFVVGGAALMAVGRRAAQTPTPVAQATQGSPTTAPTNAPGVNPTATGEAPGEAAPVETPAVITEVEANRFGSLSVALDSQGQPRQIQLALDNVPLPPAETQYVLWLGDGSSFTRLGSLVVQDGGIRFLAPVDIAVLAGLQQALVTVESDPEGASAPSQQVVFSGQFSDGQLAEFRQLVVSSEEATGRPYLAAILEQSDAAYQHQVFQVEALADGDLKQARQHTEHVINILEGKEGADFGDLDGNGRTENPGDDVGVQRYITQASQHVLAAASADPQTVQRRAQAEQAAARYAADLQALQQVVALNLKVLAADTAEEAAPLAEQAQAQFDALRNGQQGLEGLLWSNHFALGVVGMAMITDPSLASEAVPQASAAATFRLVEGNDFSLQINGLPVVPAEQVYALWARAAGAEQFTLLTVVPEGTLVGGGKAPVNLYQAFDQLALSLESNKAVPQSPTRLLLSGTLSPQAGGLLVQLTAADQGALSKAQGQADIAAEHMQYLLAAIQSNNLPLAKRHTEHIVNTLEGQDGEHYGDVNGDGNAQDPGDRVGVLGYLKRVHEEASALQNESLSPEQTAYLQQLLAVEQNSEQLIADCYEAAMKIIASDTAEEAQNNALIFQELVQALQTGRDLDGNGAIDTLTGEGGLQALANLAGLVGQVSLNP